MKDLYKLRREVCGEISTVLNSFYSHENDEQLDNLYDELRLQQEVLLDCPTEELIEKDLLTAQLNTTLIETILLTARKLTFMY